MRRMQMSVAKSQATPFSLFKLCRPFSNHTSHLGFEEPRTIKELEMTGMANLAQTKVLDYAGMSGFKSFEAEINANYSL